MRVKDYVSESIKNSPTLFKDVDFNKSKLKVLEHVFFTIGNAIELAYCENESDGGYPVYPKFKSKHDGSNERLYDKKYGEDTFPELPKTYFQDDIYYVSAINNPVDIDDSGDTIYYRFHKSNNKFYEPKLIKAANLRPFEPYPFSKNYSLCCEVYDNNLFLQDDWKEALVFLCEETIIYFKDDELCKTYPYYSDVEGSKVKTWEDHRDRQINILEKIVKKYK